MSTATLAENNDNSCKIQINKKGGKPTGEFAIVDKEDYDELSKFKWSLTKNGYTQARINGKMTKMHTHLKGKAPKGFVIDHINRNKLDNRRSNLEFRTFSENAQNKDKAPNTTSSYYGVHWDKIRNKWVASISYQKDSKNLGYFENEIDAAKKYDTAAFVLHGKNAKTNNLVRYEDVKDIDFDTLVFKNNRSYPKGISFYDDGYNVRIVYKKEVFQKWCKTYEEALKNLEEFQKKINQIKEKELEDHYKKSILYDDKNNAIIQIKNSKGEIDNVIVDAERWHELTFYKWSEHEGYYKNRKLGLMHRYIKNMAKNDSTWIDHVDKNKKNNKSSNLLPADASLNSHNRTKPEGKYSSNYYGVHKDNNSYIATIKAKNIGSFKTEIEAAIAYDIEAKKIYGSRANLNFPNGVPNEVSTVDEVIPISRSIASHSRNRKKKGGEYSSKYIGVRKTKYSYRAVIKGKHIGNYKTEIEAAKAYDAEARKIYHGNANLNFPDEVSTVPEINQVDRSLNAHNRIKPANKYSSNYIGVTKVKESYRAMIKGKHIGYYKTEIEAAKAYDSEVIKKFGNSASLNFPNEVPPIIVDEVSEVNRFKADKFFSKYFGVSKNGKSYRAVIKGKHIGSYKSEIEAAKAYDSEARKALGSDIKLNFPNEVSTVDTTQSRIKEAGKYSSKYFGVRKSGNSYRAVIKHKHIGCYKTEIEAVKAYDAEATKMLDSCKNIKLNFPNEVLNVDKASTSSS